MAGGEFSHGKLEIGTVYVQPKGWHGSFEKKQQVFPEAACDVEKARCFVEFEGFDYEVGFGGDFIFFIKMLGVYFKIGAAEVCILPFICGRIFHLPPPSCKTVNGFVRRRVERINKIITQVF